MTAKADTTARRGTVLALLWVMQIGQGVLYSEIIDRSAGHLPGTWVLQAFVWAATIGLILLWNHMVTGSIVLRSRS